MILLVGGREVNKTDFPCGEVGFTFDDNVINNIMNRGEHLDWYYSNDSDLIHLKFLVDNIRSINKDAQITLSIHYMPYSRMDRVNRGQAFTLKSVCDFINSLNLDYVTVYDPHSDVCVALLNNCRSVQYTQRTVMLAAHNTKLPLQDLVVVFPDATAEKRYHGIVAKLLPEVQTVTIIKHRNFETGKIESVQPVIPEGAVLKGKTAIIVDDLCSYGGTFVQAIEALPDIKEFFLCVGHLESSFFRGSLITHPKFKKVYSARSFGYQLDDFPLKGDKHEFI